MRPPADVAPVTVTVEVPLPQNDDGAALAVPPVGEPEHTAPGLTVAVVVADAVQPMLSVTVTVYVPELEAALVGEIVGLPTALEKLEGPAQL